MQVIVAGVLAGTRLIENLISKEIKVTVIESDQRVLKTFSQKTSDVPTILGRACKPEILYRAGADKADVLVALTGSDEDNISIAVVAKNQFHVPYVVALVNDPVHKWLFDKDLGVDFALAPDTVLADATLNSIQEAPTRTSKAGSAS